MFAARCVGTTFLSAEHKVSLKRKNRFARVLSNASNLTIPCIKQKFTYQFSLGLGNRLCVFLVGLVLLPHKIVHVFR